MKSFFRCCVFAAGVVSVAPGGNAVGAQQAPRPVSADDIEHFMTVAFGDYAVQGKRRLATWRDSAGVRLARTGTDADREMLQAVIAEINEHAGRTIYFLTPAVPEVDVHLVSPEEFEAMRQRGSQYSHALIQGVRIAPTGYIMSSRVIVRNDGTPELRTHMLRYMLAKGMGLLHVTTDGRRSMFAGTKASAKLETIDKTALRLMATHTHLAGIIGDVVRKKLQSEFGTSSNR